MYQLSRLLHDYHRDLYNHLEEHEIGPSLYAAPWFLTVFASQFPLGFVARVFGELPPSVCQPAFFCHKAALLPVWDSLLAFYTYLVKLGVETFTSCLAFANPGLA